MTPAEKQITQLYVGYFSRAADRPGFDFWVGQANAGGSILDIANSFAAGSEYTSIYGGLSNVALIDRIYDNLFNRAPDDAGKTYWLAQLDGGMSSASLVVNVMSGAQGNDKITLDNTANVAKAWTDNSIVFNMAAAQNAIASINEVQPGTGITVNITSPELLPWENEIVSNLKSAWVHWEANFNNTSQIQIDVGYAPIPGDPSTGELFASASSRMEVITASGYSNSGVAHEVITGMDPNGTIPDAFMNIHMEPGRLFSTFPATTIFAHEIGHILVNRSANQNPSASQPTSYDRWITAEGGTIAFTGPETVAAFGGPLPIHRIGGFINWAHFADDRALMEPYIGQYDYKFPLIGVIEVATLRDIGVTT